MLLIRFAMLAAVGLFAIGSAHAQPYPSKPIHVIVPFTAGSATDVVARAVAQGLSNRLGQPVVVENKPGAGGTIGTGLVTKAAPDGYTLLVNSSSHTVNPSIYKLNYDTTKDLIAIGMLAQQPNILVVSPAKGWKTAVDLAKSARAQPGKINFGSAGLGSGTHINAEKFRVSADFEAVHVPYRGTPEAINDTMSGRVDFFFAPISASLSLIRDGKLQALAVGGKNRTALLPDLATTEEQGFSRSAYNLWTGMFAPANTPPAILSQIEAQLREVLATPEIKARLGALGADVATMSTADFGRLVEAELVENAELARKAGIAVQ